MTNSITGIEVLDNSQNKLETSPEIKKVVNETNGEVVDIIDSHSGYWINKEQIDEIINKKIELLPPMPQTIVEIENLNKSDEKDIDKLLEIIQGDPMIVANILKIVNSAMYGFSNQIKNIKQASIMLGYNMTANIAISTSVNKLLNPDLSPYGISIDDFIKISGAQSRIIEKWGETKIKTIKNDLQIAAFLQELSKIIISTIIIENGLKSEFQNILKQNGNIVEVEKYFLFESAAVITSQIFSRWRFNQKIIEYIKYSDNPEESPEELRNASYALNLAKNISPVSQREFSQEELEKVMYIAEKGKFNINNLEKVLIDLKFI